MPTPTDNFQQIFEMDRMPISNYLKYAVRNRQLYMNWCKTFCTPCIYKKIKKENSNLVSAPTDFSKVDKFVIAFGKNVAFTNNPDAYIDFVTYLPIGNTNFNKISQQFDQSVSINAPYDDRFSYGNGDMVVFKYEDFIFRFQVIEEPESYAGILYRLSLNYIDKCSIADLIHLESEPKRETEGEYW